MNTYPVWKYILIALVIVTGAVFALPNIYGKDPAVQISAAQGGEISELTRFQVEEALKEADIQAGSMELGVNRLIIRFDNEETQLRAQTAIKQSLGTPYIVALNLAPATPGWLRKFGSEPMFLGLDLRGGVHFLMEVDMDAAISKAEDRYIAEIRTLLREEKVRYKTVARRVQGGILIHLRDTDEREKAQEILEEEFRDLAFSISAATGQAQITANITKEAIQTTKEFALQQNITTLRKRVNELGVAEPVIQRQGQDRIIVQLPGVQDPARAEDILGATATLEFHLVNDEYGIEDALDGRVPAGSRLYKYRNGEDILLKKQVILTGDYITDAASGIDPTSGGPDVSIRLDSKGGKLMQRGTKDNVGKRMAVVFIENKTEIIEAEGRITKNKKTIEEVINAATILEQLGRSFHITGLDSTEEARDLSLLLRAGALAAPVDIIEKRTVGPSLGQDNIKRGFNSVVLGFIGVLIFMALYYRVFGLIANVALTLNLVLVVAMLSMLQATLTLPGIAGIVLTVGMAVDANVLIFERIREEIRNGNSPQASIHAGYEKALSTIADANVTTLIAALVLFSFGTGPIKGFAVTLSLGIISSMFTAIMVTRALVNLIYGGRQLQKLAV